MMIKNRKKRDHACITAQCLAIVSIAALAAGTLAFADDDGPPHFFRGNLVVSRSVYDNNASNIAKGTVLPPNCASTTGGCSAPSGTPYDGTYPLVWNNNLYDGSFGITSKIFLDQISPTGHLFDTLEVPNTTQRPPDPTKEQMVTSFSSKSELALNLSLDGRFLTFMGYVAPIDEIDVSNSNTPGAIDPTNPVGESVLRAVAQVDQSGRFHFTETNAYSGNNGRAAILNNTPGANFFYTAGNAGNGANPQPDGVILGAGAQLIARQFKPEVEQAPGTPTPVASFNVTQLGDKADKIGKDDNFRGMTIFNNVLYFTKGSGGNGVDTVYYVDPTGTTCPSGTGVPSRAVQLPTTPLTYNPGTLQTNGLPSNMCILAGFTTVLAKNATTGFPFGLWFADENTLYVADEGDGFSKDATLFTHAAAQTTAGLQKWVRNGNTWNLAYTLQNGLNLGVPYTVSGYPTGNNPGTGLPWSPATDGLRNITGTALGDFVTIWGITSTVSGNGDQGADPNQLVAIIDRLSNTDPAKAAGEKFFAVRSAGYAEVLRGVSFAPSSTGFGDGQ
ncbi:MAG TPA: hypothetical protein VG096_23700 [Bryobacteraceae bacterium]|jgi:hypothetical protein|nr:hypothetical protein [Bryobacteraceae bacterium]